MTARAPSDDRAGEYTGRITRQLVDKAEQLFGPALNEEQLDAVLAEVMEGVEDLAETERQQLREIAQLMERSRGGQEGAHSLRCDGSFEMTPAPDQMTLALSVRPPVAGGAAVRVDDVLLWIRQHEIVRGADLQAIRRAIAQAEQGEEVQDVVCVVGRPPTPGSDARIDRFARLRNNGPPEPISARLIEAGQVLLCQKGDVVMRYVPVVFGEPGHTAMGQPIEPAAPQDIEPAIGRHIERRGDDFLAQVSGVVIFEGNRVEARKALVINQDVTRKSEPIDFDGEVQIHAAVRSDAVVKATGNIIVDGPVEAAEIESTEGDVVLRSGVAGQQAAVIRAGRDINARFAESASLFAGRDITLQVGSLHSRLIAHHHVNASQGKGQLAGGVVMAGEKVTVKQLGARGGVRTDITVGLGGEVLKTLSQIDQLAARAKQRRDNCTELIEQIERAIGDATKLSARELETYTRLRQLQLVCDVQLRKLNTRRHDVLAESARHVGGRVEVLISVMSNVCVSIGTGELQPDGQRGPCAFVFDERTQKVIIRRGT